MVWFDFMMSKVERGVPNASGYRARSHDRGRRSPLPPPFSWYRKLGMRVACHTAVPSDTVPSRRVRTSPRRLDRHSKYRTYRRDRASPGGPAGGRGRSPFAPTSHVAPPGPRRATLRVTTIPSGGSGGAASARSAPRPHVTANGEIEADEHHERDNPLIALGRTVRDDKHAAVVDVRRASPQEGPNF